MYNFREVVGIQEFLEVRKNFKLLEHKHIIYHFEAGDWRLRIYNLFRKIFKFREDKATMYFAKLA